MTDSTTGWEAELPEVLNCSLPDCFMCTRAKEFIRSLLAKDREELVKAVEGMKLLEVAVNPETLMWKQRMNAQLDDVLALITRKD